MNLIQKKRFFNCISMWRSAGEAYRYPAIVNLVDDPPQFPAASGGYQITSIGLTQRKSLQIKKYDHCLLQLTHTSGFSCFLTTFDGLWISTVVSLLTPLENVKIEEFSATNPTLKPPGVRCWKPSGGSDLRGGLLISLDFLELPITFQVLKNTKNFASRMCQLVEIAIYHVFFCVSKISKPLKYHHFPVWNWEFW